MSVYLEEQVANERDVYCNEFYQLSRSARDYHANYLSSPVRGCDKFQAFGQPQHCVPSIEIISVIYVCYIYFGYILTPSLAI